MILARWVGVFSVIFSLGGGQRLSVLPTINLAQASEFALVLASLGVDMGHIQEDTFTLIVWIFVIFAVFASPLLKHNHAIFNFMQPYLTNWGCVHRNERKEGNEEDEDEEERDILFLGFYKLASALVSEFEERQ